MEEFKNVRNLAMNKIMPLNDKFKDSINSVKEEANKLLEIDAEKEIEEFAAKGK
jgi:hypothetical protein